MPLELDEELLCSLVVENDRESKEHEKGPPSSTIWSEGVSVALLSDAVVVVDDDDDDDDDAIFGFFLGNITLGGESDSSGKLNPGFVFPYFLAVLSYTRAASSS